MKLRKRYTLVINSNTRTVTICKTSSNWAKYLQRTATCGIKIYDCTFDETKFNLKILSQNNYFISKRR